MDDRFFSLLAYIYIETRKVWIIIYSENNKTGFSHNSPQSIFGLISNSIKKLESQRRKKKQLKKNNARCFIKRLIDLGWTLDILCRLFVAWHFCFWTAEMLNTA